MLGLLLPLYRATDWQSDPHCRQRRHGLRLPGRVPGGPATRMQPDVAGGIDAVGQQCIVSVFTIATSETAPGPRAFRVAVQPLRDAARVGPGLGLKARHLAVRLDRGDALVEEGEPVLRRPTVIAPSQQGDDAGF